MLIPDRVNLLDDTEVRDFVESMKRVSGEMEKRHNMPLGVVVFDTLARCMPGGNENSSEHMGKAVDNADSIRRRLGNITGMFCHHSGKDASKGARGHTSLPGAADTMVELSKDNSRLITFRNSKQKDEQDGVKLHFRLQRVIVGQNAWGGEETSCVVIDSREESGTVLGPNRAPLRGASRIAYDCLTQAVIDYGEQVANVAIPSGVKAVKWQKWAEFCAKGGLILNDDREKQRKAFEAAGKFLRERGFIGVSSPWVWQAK
jgi:hypothetical protein